MNTTFTELGVPEPICRALAERGITTPFDIQAATIADALAGRDVCGRAPTGSGKTLAFGIPLIATVEDGEPLTPAGRGRPGRPGRPRALVLAPTRELAEQISAELETIAGDVRLGVVYGGVGYARQVGALRRGVDLLVACPGRLEDLMAQDLVDLSLVTKVVIDEADRMADMGFLPAVRRLLDRTAEPRQTVLFSATLDGDVARLTADYQRDPVRHEVGEAADDGLSGDHVFWRADATNRTELTAEAVNAVWPAIVFSRTRHGSDRLARQLRAHGIVTAAIHGGRSQTQRNQALADFTAGRVHALVATDVAARGIHVDGVASVIHYDPPEDHKAYIHRSGRTARAGRRGVVLSLIRPAEVKDLRRLQREVGLDEPLVDPDPAALRALSGTTAPAPADHRPTAPAADAADRAGAGRDRRTSTADATSARGPRSGRPRTRSADDAAPDRPERRSSSDDDRDERTHRPRQGLVLTSRKRTARPSNRPSPAAAVDDARPTRSPRSTGRTDDRPRPRQDDRPRTGGEDRGFRRDDRAGAEEAGHPRDGERRDPSPRAGGPRTSRGAGPRSGARADGGLERTEAGAGGARRSGPAAKGRATARTGTARSSSQGSGSGRAATTTTRSGSRSGGHGRPSSPGPKPGGNRKARRAHLQWDANR